MAQGTVLVSGIGGSVALGVLRIIRLTFPEIRIIGTDINVFNAGCHLCDATFEVPYAFDPQFLPTIQEIIENENVDLVIPTTDYEVHHLAMAKDLLCANVASSDSHITEQFLDKYLTFLLSQDVGFSFAQSFLPSQYPGSFENFVVKPREGRGSRDIHLNPDSPNEFSDNFVVQPLLVGTEISTAFYVSKEELHGFITLERSLENGATQQCRVNQTWDNEVEKIVERICTIQGVSGSINLQSMVLENGDVVPFEINGRISGTNSIRHNLGFQDVVYTIQEHLLDQSPTAPEVQNGVAIRYLTDVIYPEARHPEDLTDNSAPHIIF